MKAYCYGVLVLALAAGAAAQQAAVPVEEEPHHHVVLKNEFVEVLHVVLPAGESTLLHTHSHDRAAIHLTQSMITLQPAGEPEGKSAQSEIGEVSASTLRDAPYTHRVHNVGANTFEVVDVEFLRRPKQASEAAAATVVAENPSARVYKWVLAPGASTPQHTHKRPYLIVAVTNLQLKMAAPDGKTMSHEVKAGDAHWVDAEVTHSLTNEGTTEGQIVELELK